MLIKGLIYFIEAGAYKYGLDARKEVHKRGNQKFSLNSRSHYTYVYAVRVYAIFFDSKITQICNANRKKNPYLVI